jgi:hypothetical protein
MSKYDPIFAIGDKVCIKCHYESPLGPVDMKKKDVMPFLVQDVIVDSLTKDRVGEPGGSHTYRVTPLPTDRYDRVHTLSLYQFQLCYWKDVKDEVILENLKYIQRLRDI